MSRKTAKLLKSIILSLIIPAVTYLFFRVICDATGHPGFGIGSDLQTIIYTSVYSGLIALAMFLNLTSGRFDFSIGATLVLAIILGGNLARDMKLTGIQFLVVTMVIGALIGLVSGLVYVILGLPPMVVSLGLAMIYEALGFMYNKAKGVKLIGKNSLLIFAKFPENLILMAAVLLVLVFLLEFTRIGYNRNALASGQKIAVDVGIREKQNAVICYVMAGALLGLAGCVYISKYGLVTPETGLSSSSYFMSAFLPIFIAGAIGKYSSAPIGVFIGAVTQAIITSGFAKLGMGSSLQTVLNSVIVLLFLIYSSNSYLLIEQRMFKEKLEKAKAAREKKQAQ
jgi:ribose transport system permease protein